MFDEAFYDYEIEEAADFRNIIYFELYFVIKVVWLYQRKMFHVTHLITYTWEIGIGFLLRNKYIILLGEM